MYILTTSFQALCIHVEGSAAVVIFKCEATFLHSCLYDSYAWQPLCELVGHHKVLKSLTKLCVVTCGLRHSYWQSANLGRYFILMADSIFDPKSKNQCWIPSHRARFWSVVRTFTTHRICTCYVFRYSTVQRSKLECRMSWVKTPEQTKNSCIRFPNTVPFLWFY